MRSFSFAILFLALTSGLRGQQAPYDVFPAAEAPYFRVRYEAPAGVVATSVVAPVKELVFGVNYTVWVPPGVKTLRGVIVHQHGCGEGSCKSGLTGAFDLHWQALARKHDCALLAPAYEQPEKANCQLWCDPRNGSDAAFQKALVDLGAKSGHPELATVPWALWGHSGGGHWAGGIVLLHPERVVAAWLRSGVPPVKAAENKPTSYTISEAALRVPVMCNLGTKEGVTVKEGRFAGVWPGVQTFFQEMRGKGALIAVAPDPLTSHECGNQRYLAIPWLDACLTARLPAKGGEALRAMPAADGWIAPLYTGEPNIVAPVPAAKFTASLENTVWLPNESLASAWAQYVKDSAVPDNTPPPAPTHLEARKTIPEGGKDFFTLTWQAEADLESGLAGFIIERDGQVIAKVPAEAKNPFGRPVFQGLQYSDTPTQPLVRMDYTDTTVPVGQAPKYRVIAVNTVGLKSRP